MVTVVEELERALQLSSRNTNHSLPPIIPPGTSSLCGPPSNPSETSGPSMSPGHFGPLQMSPAFSLNSSQSSSNSLATVKFEAEGVEEPKGHQEDASLETGISTSMVEMKKSRVQLHRVQVVLKTNGQVQMSPGHMQDARSKIDQGTGLKMAKKRPTESSGRDKVKCDECGKFVSKNHVPKHKRIVHRGETPYKCLVEDCGMWFANTSSLSNHKRVNHGYPKLKCKVEGCDSEFLFRSQFDSHCQTHQGKNECDECGKSFAPRHLSAHKKEVHRGEKRVACKEIGCTESFSRNDGLGDHRRIVHGFPKLKCRIGECTADFMYKNHLLVHAKEHLI